MKKLLRLAVLASVVSCKPTFAVEDVYNVKETYAAVGLDCTLVQDQNMTYVITASGVFSSGGADIFIDKVVHHSCRGKYAQQSSLYPATYEEFDHETKAKLKVDIIAINEKTKTAKQYPIKFKSNDVTILYECSPKRAPVTADSDSAVEYLTLLYVDLKNFDVNAHYNYEKQEFERDAEPYAYKKMPNGSVQCVDLNAGKLGFDYKNHMDTNKLYIAAIKGVDKDNKVSTIHEEVIRANPSDERGDLGSTMYISDNYTHFESIQVLLTELTKTDKVNEYKVRSFMMNLVEDKTKYDEENCKFIEDERPLGQKAPVHYLGKDDKGNNVALVLSKVYVDLLFMPKVKLSYKWSKK